jgi:hypothetical protein
VVLNKFRDDLKQIDRKPPKEIKRDAGTHPENPAAPCPYGIAGIISDASVLVAFPRGRRVRRCLYGLLAGKLANFGKGINAEIFA